MLVTGKSLFDFTHSNQLVANQKLMPDEINITMIPNQKGGKPGQYLKPSMFLSMAETSADKDAAAEADELLHHRPCAPTTSCRSSAASPATPAFAQRICRQPVGHREEDHRLSRHRRHVGRPAAAAAAEERRRARPRAAPGLGVDLLREGRRRRTAPRSTTTTPRRSSRAPDGDFDRGHDGRRRSPEGRRRRRRPRFRSASGAPGAATPPAICSCCPG